MAITYDLRAGNYSSDEFYSSLSDFVDLLISKKYPEFEPLIRDYMSYLQVTDQEKLRTPEEYFFDIMLLGVLWNEYGERAQNLSIARATLLKSLYNLRRRNKLLKPYIDKMRGIFATRWLSGDEDSDALRYPDITECNKLLEWMQAAGDFREESIRINLLLNYLTSLNSNEYEKSAASIIDFARAFKFQAVEYFQEYTGKVSEYIQSEGMKKRWQENVIFCTRREIEYIMNLVGSELMNRAFQHSFYESKKQFALLPACMRNNPDRCRAKKLDLEMICTGCDEECNVYRYRELGRREGFAVRIIPHSSDFSRWLQEWAVGKDYGVIGVACPLHLIAGGLELRKLDIAAQCVFLDYCGCKNHWHQDGIMTDLNSRQLLKITNGSSAQRAA